MVLPGQVFSPQAQEFVNGTMMNIRMDFMNKSYYDVSSPTECKAWCTNQILLLKDSSHAAYYMLLIPLFMHCFMIFCYWFHRKEHEDQGLQCNDDCIALRIAYFINSYGFVITTSLCAGVLVWFMWWRLYG